MLHKGKGTLEVSFLWQLQSKLNTFRQIVSNAFDSMISIKRSKSPSPLAHVHILSLSSLLPVETQGPSVSRTQTQRPGRHWNARPALRPTGSCCSSGTRSKYGGGRRRSGRRRCMVDAEKGETIMEWVKLKQLEVQKKV